TVVSLAALKVTVGATLLTVTDWCAVAPVALSESVALAVRSAVSGPSGKVHWKLPEVLPLLSESATFVPCGESQLVETLLTVSLPGSEIDLSLLCALPFLTVVSLAALKVTVGATLLTVTDWCAVAPVALSESVALAV